jgi:hypothetical protein
MTEEQAKRIASMMLDAASEAREFARKTDGTFFDGFDYWYGISEDWDVNIFCGDDEVLKATISPVVNGDTDTVVMIPVDRYYDTNKQREEALDYHIGQKLSFELYGTEKARTGILTGISGDIFLTIQVNGIPYCVKREEIVEI